jgi:hypothetical protein
LRHSPRYGGRQQSKRSPSMCVRDRLADAGPLLVENFSASPRPQSPI